jgi:ABC-type transport system involved in multi-copper enzyme maturation permease subunit
MTPKQLVRTLRWLVRDTFCQALANRLFWLMLGITAVVVLFCLSVGIERGEPLHTPDDAELSPPHGRVTMAFGAFRGPLFRDGEAAVRFLQLVLAEGVAGAGGILLALVFTAGFVPTFLDPRSSAVLLAKPVPRWLLLLGKSGGVVAFVGVQAAVFALGTWVALGLRTGYWPAGYLLCLPLLLIHFGVIYSGSVLLGVCTRSTVVAVFGSVVLWLLCWGMNYGRHAVVALPQLDPGAAAFPESFRVLVEAGYWLLPKPADLGMLLQQAVLGAGEPCAVPQFEAVRRMNAFCPELSVLTSLAFAAGLFAAAARQLATTEY